MNTNEVINNCLNKLSPKKVLDLGIGKGRCSKRFLQKGSIITGVDLVNTTIPGINFFQCNIKDFKFNQDYDLIIASLVLHFLKLDVSKDIIEKMKESTVSGGYNFILTMNKEDNFFRSKKENFYLNKNDLEKLYPDWEIIQSGDFETDLEKHDDLKPHKHNLSFILAKKINLNS